MYSLVPVSTKNNDFALNGVVPSNLFYVIKMQKLIVEKVSIRKNSFSHFSIFLVKKYVLKYIEKQKQTYHLITQSLTHLRLLSVVLSESMLVYFSLGFRPANFF